MKISHVTIRNILGVAELDFEPGGFTVVRGPNGSGKTTVLEAIKAVTQGGHDATLLRKGADKGEAVLVLDDGTVLSKTVTPSASTSAVQRNGKKLSGPAGVIKALTDALSVNPVDFLRAPKKDRVRVLLEAMPLEADARHLSELAGIEVRAQPGVHALHVIEQVRTQVYDERTGTNRAVREKQGTISQLEAAVPPAPAGADGDEDDLQAGLEAAAQQRDSTLQRITVKIDGLRAKAAADIDAIRAEMQQRIDAVREDLAEQERRATAAREKDVTAFTEAAAPLNAQLAAIRHDREAAGRRKQTLETIEAMRTELGALQDEAARQTAALEQIDAYKSALLSSLPIPGLEVKDGEIYRDGVPFDRLNTSQQVGIAIEIAKLRAADLGIICCDGLELMDSDHFEALRAQAADSGLQFFVTRVSDDEFSIDTE